MIHFIVVVIGFFLAELKALDFLYYFQVKEYRPDRFAAMLKDRDRTQVFFAIGRFPAKTIRNVLASAITTCLLLAWSAVIFKSNILLAASLAGYWIVAFLATSAGVLITWLPSFLRKRILITAASVKMKQSKVTVIGITGSFGKTNTKEYLYDILSQKYPTAKTPNNMNTDVGVAQSVLRNVNKHTRLFIAEMGAYTTGEIEDICRIVHPHYGILTAIGNQHLHLFGSPEKLLMAKKELLLSLPATGKAYVNAGRAPFEKLKTGVKAQVVPYYRQEKSVDLKGYKLPPAVIEENLIPCILLARELGLTEKEIRSGITVIKDKRQRLTPLHGKNGTIIIDNSYNTNREGFLLSIGILEGRSEKNKFIVTRGIIELGNEKGETYDRILHVLAKSNVSLFTTDADFGKGSIKNVRIFDNEDALRAAIVTKLQPATAILIEGKMNRDFISFLATK